MTMGQLVQNIPLTVVSPKMKMLKENCTADNPEFVCPKGTIFPNLGHIVASSYPQARRFYLFRETCTSTCF